MSLSRIVRHAGMAVFATVALQSTAGAQGANITLYSSFNFSSDNPNAPFVGTPICGGAVGGSNGFNVNFGDALTRAALCPLNPNAINPAIAFFAARFTGDIWAPAAGFYDLGLSADDGEVVSINGTIVDNEWTLIKGGGPGDATVFLNEGDNSFVFDYNNRFTGGGFARLLSADTPVTFTPEPSTIALMSSGLLVLAGVARRKKANS